MQEKFNFKGILNLDVQIESGSTRTKHPNMFFESENLIHIPNILSVHDFVLDKMLEKHGSRKNDYNDSQKKIFFFF